MKSDRTKIGWTHYTFNPWIGCTKVSAGCTNCYAEREDKFRKWTPEGWGKGQPRRRTSPANWRKPLKWNRLAEKEGVRFKVFCASLADIFDSEVPQEWRDDLFALIQATPHLDWLLLTKRIESVAEMVPSSYAASGWPENVWLGVSAEDQETADERIPQLLQFPAVVRFVSAEPLIGALDLTDYLEREWSEDHGGLPGDFTEQGVNWVIVGGESGPTPRPMPIEWARKVMQDCADAGVPFFMKQLSQADHKDFKNKEVFPGDLRLEECPETYEPRKAV